MMTMFKTLDIRGLSFFNAFHLTSQAVNEVKSNGIVEIILDKKKNFTDAFRNWAAQRGYTVSDMDEDNGLIRLFIKKVTRFKNKKKK